MTREVDPDFIGSWGGISHLFPRSFRFWGVSEDGEGGEVCCFKPNQIISMEITDSRFEPRPDGRWMEHLEEYHRSGLGDDTG